MSLAYGLCCCLFTYSFSTNEVGCLSVPYQLVVYISLCKPGSLKTQFDEIHYIKGIFKLLWFNKIDSIEDIPTHSKLIYAVII